MTAGDFVQAVVLADFRLGDKSPTGVKAVFASCPGRRGDSSAQYRSPAEVIGVVTSPPPALKAAADGRVERAPLVLQQAVEQIVTALRNLGDEGLVQVAAVLAVQVPLEELVGGAVVLGGEADHGRGVVIAVRVAG